MNSTTLLKIGDAAAALGIEAHVLRHWESVGLLAPPRTPAGHRGYDEQTLYQARLIRILQRTGLSLDQIHALGRTDLSGRQELIAARRAEIQERVVVLRRTDLFLEHLLSCHHPVISECPECADFARSDRTGPRPLVRD
ncbi:MerR family transcriptional regulator [Nocardia yamanashiensis]|uniref:MerR family transcriptional regulator n=1 Tax=Nocardia yamanashiensis TaxID=209247 RepID=UPI001E338EE7|nr:MerR family transcriptional regulator [Nocardia yamanashiensis]UGT43716.1 MerR family transcriptional regulator [Nocardia yamanashiensis]